MTISLELICSSLSNINYFNCRFWDPQKLFLLGKHKHTAIQKFKELGWKFSTCNYFPLGNFPLGHWGHGIKACFWNVWRGFQIDRPEWLNICSRGSWTWLQAGQIMCPHKPKPSSACKTQRTPLQPFPLASSCIPMLWKESQATAWSL